MFSKQPLEEREAPALNIFQILLSDLENNKLGRCGAGLAQWSELSPLSLWKESKGSR